MSVTSASSVHPAPFQRSSDSRANAFDALRLLLALLVVYTHATLLGGFGFEVLAEFSRGQTSFGTLAVTGFFGLSGFLVTTSFLRQPHWKRFLAARALRILPGFLLALLLGAFVFAPLISWLSHADNHWQLAQALRYLSHNSLIRVGTWTVGDELTGLPYTGSLNGPLWSLWPEVLCYIGTLALGVCGMLRAQSQDLRMFFALALGLNLVTVVAPNQSWVAPTFLTLSPFGPLFLAFATGALVATEANTMPWSRLSAALYLALLLGLLRFGGWTIFGPIALAMFLLHAAHSWQIRMKVDLSYGIYLLHFPVLQALAASQFHDYGLLTFLISGMAISAIAAWCSWHLVERPMLGLKKRWSKPRESQIEH